MIIFVACLDLLNVVANDLTRGYTTPPLRAVTDGMAGAKKSSAAVMQYPRPNDFCPKRCTKCKATRVPRFVLIITL